MIARRSSKPEMPTWRVWYLCLLFSKTVAAECGETGGHQLRQLQDGDHDPLAKESGGRAGLQRLRTLLQVAQREFALINYYLLLLFY